MTAPIEIGLGINDQALQLSVSTSKPDHTSKLLEATKNDQVHQRVVQKMANHTMLIMIITTPINFRVVHIIWVNMSTKHATIMTSSTK